MFKNTDKIYLIGEIGINHNGDIGIAKKLIDAVSATGWDCAKFQKRSPDICVPEDKKNDIRETPWGKMKYIDYKHKIEFGKKEYDKISKECKKRSIDWSTSIWDFESLDFIMENYPDIKFIKIPSALNNNYELIKESCETGLPIIVSLGMSDINMTDKLMNVLNKYSSNFCILHTNSAYPSPHEDLNLSLIPFLIERYKCPVGYSGHEADLDPTVVAVSLGARVIERHITLDHTMWGTDHSSSLEIRGMTTLKTRINDIPKMIGTPEKKIFESEKPFISKLRNDSIRRS
jgi:N-acetylneuraminate synthase